MKTNPDEYQVTVWGHPDEVLETRHGNITYKHYLETESRRWMEGNMRDSWIRINPEGLVAMFTWRKYMTPVAAEE